MVELRAALNALGLSTDIPQAATVLAKYDTDASGRLEYPEFKTLVLQLRAFQAGSPRVHTHVFTPASHLRIAPAPPPRTRACRYT